MASLRDIASELEVSESLVSKVLSGKMGTTGIRPEVAAQIRHTARRMCYKPNRNAAALASGKHASIAVFVHQAGEPCSGIVVDLIEGIAGAASACGQQLWLSFFDSADAFRRLCPLPHGTEVDGVIVAGVSHAELTAELVRQVAVGVPVVTVHHSETAACLPNVGVDEAAVGATGTAHLLAAGCRRLAHFHHFPARFDGFRAAHEARGVPWDPELVIETSSFSFEDGLQAIGALMARGLTFDGVVAQSDSQAVAAMNRLLAEGVAIPGEVRIVGVDNSPICPMAPVPLSSVSEFYGERGRRAVHMLMDLIAGESVSSVNVEPALVPRCSSGAL
jgi:DNA-binding LacI/PurR family transcriptional regulator